MLFTASRAGVIRCWDLGSGKETKQFADPKHPAQALALAPDGKLLASGGEDGVVCFWDLTMKSP